MNKHLIITTIDGSSYRFELKDILNYESIKERLYKENSVESIILVHTKVRKISFF